MKQSEALPPILLRASGPGCRPELLLDGEFQRLPAALEKLEAAFPNSDVGGMVAAQPLLLVEDIEVVIEELRRRAPCGRRGVQQTCGWTLCNWGLC